MSDEYEKRAQEIISRNTDSAAMVKLYEEKFNRICNEISDEKVREALNILERLSWARHVKTSMFIELNAEIGDIGDAAISAILTPILEQFIKQRKYLEDLK